MQPSTQHDDEQQSFAEFAWLARLAWNLRASGIGAVLALDPGRRPSLRPCRTSKRPTISAAVREGGWVYTWGRGEGEYIRVDATDIVEQVAAALSVSARHLGRIDLPAADRSVSEGRAFIRSTLSHVRKETVADIVLLTSEVLTNAIRHSDSARPGGVVTLVVTDCGETIQVEVIDEGSATSTPRVRTDPDGQSLGGRGLWLVDQMSHSWGSREHTAGRVVWFRLLKTRTP